MKSKKLYHETCDFLDAKYKGYWAFSFLLNCTEQQFQNFLDTPDLDCFEDFIWAYNSLFWICKKR